MFWQDLWTNLIADILAGVLLSFLIIKILERIRQPHLDVVLSIGTGTKGRRTFIFYCHNTGKTGLLPNEIQWHVYFDAAFQVQNRELEQIRFSYQQREHYAITGYNKTPCLPNSSCELLTVDVVINSKDLIYDSIDQAPFYFSMTTVKGKISNSTSTALPKIKVVDQIERFVFQVKKVEL